MSTPSVRLLIGVAVTILALALPAAAAADVSPPAASITLLSQTPYLVGPGLFSVHVAVTAPDPGADRIEISAYPQVITRTDFDSALKGRMNTYVSSRQYVAAGSLDGQLDIPVNQAVSGSKLNPLGAPAPGVYPVQLQLVGPSGEKLGSALTTFLVWAPSAQNAPLSVTVVIPVSSPVTFTTSGQPASPSGAEADRLRDLSAALNADSSVSAAVLSDPLTLSGLRSGSVTDRETLANLAGTSKNGLVQVLPAYYSPVNVAALGEAGLGSDVDTQLRAGTEVLSQTYGAAPSSGTWVVNGALDGASLSALASHHATQLIVPDADLTPIKPGYTQYTFAVPTVVDYGSIHLPVLAADAGITADFAAADPPVLAANHLLAELAMIQTEQPSNQRAVAALPPLGWQASPAFVQTLLTGLDGNPLVKAVTPSTVFSELAPKELLTRQLASPGTSSGPASSALSADSAAIQAARAQIQAIDSVLAGQSGISTAALQLDLLAAESASVSEAQRHGILTAIGAAANRATRQINLPAAGSMTLTARQGQLPITILAPPSLRARVELRLTSQRLIFQPFSLPGVSCRIPTPTEEICTLSLSTQNTTVKVPVQTRSSGVFPLDVSLYSPGGALRLAHDSDTVRSTAVSNVGVVLIVVAVLSLLLWWGRDLRHGRRARRLVPSPVEQPDQQEIVWPDDPLVHQFFTTPAPQHKPNGDRSISEGT
ncbi:MAG: hypothetical protein JO337_08170 [Acidimicrobiales bacterium]|nr:hypothetical protein [Acidimicrobiales bacterium]